VGPRGLTDNLFVGDHRVGAAIRRAHEDAVAWVAANQDQIGRGSVDLAT
jgi:hypothetical protein